jgi:hypothetical protein
VGRGKAGLGKVELGKVELGAGFPAAVEGGGPKGVGWNVFRACSWSVHARGLFTHGDCSVRSFHGFSGCVRFPEESEADRVQPRWGKDSGSGLDRRRSRWRRGRDAGMTGGGRKEQGRPASAGGGSGTSGPGDTRQRSARSQGVVAGLDAWLRDRTGDQTG